MSDDTDEFAEFDDVAGDQEPKKDNPFGNKPKFDAGVEADEEEDPEKFIQQLSGKLGQALRDYTDKTGEVDSDLEKYAVNSVISATHPDQMETEDIEDIIDKLQSSDNKGGEGNEEKEVEPEIEDESLEENFVLDKEHKQVFADAKLGLNEGLNKNVSKYLCSLIDPSLKSKKTKLENMVDTPTLPRRKVEPTEIPVERPSRRSMPFRPKIRPSEDPTPKQKF